VLAVEGETEAIHAPGVLAMLGPADAEALVHITVLEGVDQNPVPMGALTATPKTTLQSEDGRYWWVMRPRHTQGVSATDRRRTSTPLRDEDGGLRKPGSAPLPCSQGA
jgi:hypothetical protein